METPELQIGCEDGHAENGAAEMEAGKEVQWRVWAEEEVAAPAERVWEVVSQFCGAHVWLASLETCEKVEGEERVAGCVRLCKGSSDFSEGGLGSTEAGPPRAAGVWMAAAQLKPRPPPKNWSRERLLLLDDAGMVLSYEVMDSNLGLRGYSATFQVLVGTASTNAPRDTNSCRLRWSADLDPVPSTSRDRLSHLLCQLFRRNVHKLRDIVCTVP